MALNGISGANAARVYLPNQAARPDAPPAATTTAAESPTAVKAPGLTRAQAHRAVAAQNAAAANPVLDDAAQHGLAALARRAADVNARPGARVDLHL